MLLIAPRIMQTRRSICLSVWRCSSMVSSRLSSCWLSARFSISSDAVVEVSIEVFRRVSILRSLAMVYVLFISGYVGIKWRVIELRTSWWAGRTANKSRTVSERKPWSTLLDQRWLFYVVPLLTDDAYLCFGPLAYSRRTDIRPISRYETGAESSHHVFDKTDLTHGERHIQAKYRNRKLILQWYLHRRHIILFGLKSMSTQQLLVRHFNRCQPTRCSNIPWT